MPSTPKEPPPRANQVLTVEGTLLGDTMVTYRNPVLAELQLTKRLATLTMLVLLSFLAVHIVLISLVCSLISYEGLFVTDTRSFL